MDDATFMWRAIEKVREGIIAGQSPFAQAVVKDGKVVAATHNTVWRDTDPTCHAEVNAIRQAAAALASINLTGCVMYTTCEPCPMCLARHPLGQVHALRLPRDDRRRRQCGVLRIAISSERTCAAGRQPARRSRRRAVR